MNDELRSELRRMSLMLDTDVNNIQIGQELFEEELNKEIPCIERLRELRESIIDWISPMEDTLSDFTEGIENLNKNIILEGLEDK